ncbi:MAG: SHOCT domain-containing protein [Oscillospiraceae bacterium]|nr:SHOCT domain-containing protein [Oscillospiraceae bacterium]
MDTQNIVVTANVGYIFSKVRKIILLVFLGILAASLIVGFFFESYYGHSDGDYDPVYEEYGPAYDYCKIEWYYLPLFDYDSRDFPTTDWEPNTIIQIALFYTIVAAIPFVIKALYEKMCKNTALCVTDEYIIGSYNSFIFKKSLQMPIEKVDNLTISSTFLDKLRTGKTLGVCSASGVIKLHFVQNAEEVVSLTMERINEMRNNEKHAQSTPQIVAAAPATVSTTEKLKELVSMKEAGLISEEEFAKKREDLLAKM